jgi:hypothetical protein
MEATTRMLASVLLNRINLYFDVCHGHCSEALGPRTLSAVPPYAQTVRVLYVGGCVCLLMLIHST